MNVEEHEVYQEFEPAEGSKLYELIATDVEAQNALQEIDDAIADLNENIKSAGRFIDNISWDWSNYEEARQAIVDRQVLRVMVKKAKEERQKRINAQLATEKAVQNAINPLQHHARVVAQHEANMQAVPGLVSSSDKEKAAKSEEMLADARERLLT